jgi:penicillin-binding protein 1A
LLKVGDLAQFSIQEMHETTARVQLEQQPAPQAAMVTIDNPTGEIKALVGGYSFEDSKFNRASQSVRQVGSSFKIYVYADAIEKGSSPFDTILDAPFTTVSGGQPYSPRNYDEKFEGNITLRRALAGSRNVPAVKLAEKVGINSVVDMTRKFGITTPLPPYLPLALGSADMKLIEHVSAFTVFPDDGIRIDPHMIRRVTSYDGALLEAHPSIHEVIPRSGTYHDCDARGSHSIWNRYRRQIMKRPAAGKTGTPRKTTPMLVYRLHAADHHGRVGQGATTNRYSAKRNRARGAADLMQFMQNALAGHPRSISRMLFRGATAAEHIIHVDTPDTAPAEDEPPARRKPPAGQRHRKLWRKADRENPGRSAQKGGALRAVCSGKIKVC